MSVKPVMLLSSHKLKGAVMHLIKNFIFTIAATLLAALILLVKNIGPLFLLVPDEYFIVDIIVSALIIIAGFLIDSYLSEIARLKNKDAELRRCNLDLVATNASLRDYMAQIKVLRGMLPICAKCNRIRDDQGHWKELGAYLGAHSEAKVMNSLCPKCMDKLAPD